MFSNVSSAQKDSVGKGSISKVIISKIQACDAFNISRILLLTMSRGNEGEANFIFWEKLKKVYLLQIENDQDDIFGNNLLWIDLNKHPGIKDSLKTIFDKVFTSAENGKYDPNIENGTNFLALKKTKVNNHHELQIGDMKIMKEYSKQIQELFLESRSLFIHRPIQEQKTCMTQSVTLENLCSTLFNIGNCND